MSVKLSFFVVATGFLAACSNAATSADGGISGDASTVRCSARSGVYSFDEVFVSGNCGAALAPQSFNMADSNQSIFAIPFFLGEKAGAGGSARVVDYFPGYSGTVSVSADNCTIEYSVNWPFSGQPGSGRKVGTATGATDGRSGKSTENFSAFDANGTGTCTGEYKASLSK